MVEISNVLDRLVKYWQEESIPLASGTTGNEIAGFENVKGIRLPAEFHQYFTTVNGMESFYPNYTDSNGFLFYPLEELNLFEDEFAGYPAMELNLDLVNKKCLIFANYLHKSWTYGVVIGRDTGEYSIVKILDHSRYVAIANSLSDFLEKYLVDADILY